jgi:hypothetical protein
MLYKIHIKLTEKVRQFCLDYTLNNSHDRSYSNNELLEFYPEVDNFIANFNFKNICIGKLPTGNVQKHIDDGRDSALIIPITNSKFVIHTDDGSHEFTDSFIIDTTQNHGASSDFNSVFLAIDLDKPFLETKMYLESFSALNINTK